MSARRASGLEDLRLIEDFDLKDKTVFLRVDFNVPMQNGEITDDKRIQAAIPTINYALQHQAKLVLASHFGRPKTDGDRQKFSLDSVAVRLGELLDKEILLVEEPAGDAVKGLLSGLKNNQVILLENLRFEKGETKDSHELALDWAEYTDVYINDAFGASHRKHASMHALPKLIEQKGIGYLVKKEIQVLDELLGSAKSPFFAVLGGAKVSDKIKVIQELVDFVDVFVVGGAMAYTFLKAQGINVGSSLVEVESLSYVKDLIKRLEMREKRILLPVDHVVSQDFSDSSNIRTTNNAAIDSGWMGLDIGPKTADLYAKELEVAKTIFWNGPMGVFEKEEFSKGTFAIAKTLGSLTDAITVVGGGDSASAAKESGFADKMSHISTGGGASLEYLQGDVLPGLAILKNHKKIEEEPEVLGSSELREY